MSVPDSDDRGAADAGRTARHPMRRMPESDAPAPEPPPRFANAPDATAPAGERGDLTGDEADSLERARAILAAMEAEHEERRGTVDRRRRRRMPPPMSVTRASILAFAASGAAVVTTAVILRGVPDESPTAAVISGGLVALIGAVLTGWLVGRVGTDPTRTPTAWMAATAVRLLSVCFVMTVMILVFRSPPVSAGMGGLSAALASLVLDVWVLRRQVMGLPAGGGEADRGTPGDGENVGS